ncbi:hypothetical protein AMELA_G00109570 [Ameiurus melas]|uniref:Uncharacterized protein n=1 Tax=Ameiurus melas TaxID=219545 RepID=A0A7J6APD8_AMEME|nr:hypothetical protein AMELA_G00109570 [Ameiurus melas]
MENVRVKSHSETYRHVGDHVGTMALDFINTLFCLARSQCRLKCTEKLAGSSVTGGGLRGVCGHATDPSHLFLLDQEAVTHPRPSCKRPKELVSRLEQHRSARSRTRHGAAWGSSPFGAHGAVTRA